MSSRRPLPDTPLGAEETRILYNRYHGLKNKAAEKGIEFAWESFEGFISDVLSMAPDGYLPSRYRMTFDFNNGGYCKETMKLNPGKSIVREGKNERAPARSTLRQKVISTPDWELILELTVVLMTTDDTLTALVQRAQQNLGREVHSSEREDVEETATDHA